MIKNAKSKFDWNLYSLNVDAYRNPDMATLGIFRNPNFPERPSQISYTAENFYNDLFFLPLNDVSLPTGWNEYNLIQFFIAQRACQFCENNKSVQIFWPFRVKEIYKEVFIPNYEDLWKDSLKCLNKIATQTVKKIKNRNLENITYTIDDIKSTFISWRRAKYMICESNLSESDWTIDPSIILMQCPSYRNPLLLNNNPNTIYNERFLNKFLLPQLEKEAKQLDLKELYTPEKMMKHLNSLKHKTLFERILPEREKVLVSESKLECYFKKKKINSM
ncbi:hypothetical protein C1645_830183 [Glomus cerebriforme]|uniref:Uncharacterized protein n=1 Tax=Glomus cerebriforme TaxID=658196 RepID=A0A397SLQ8_9GLOM|nr:hypothetical protein C1645_830183 [Glomus cerebriforme]